jgi:ankyrin repeat protein
MRVRILINGAFLAAATALGAATNEPTTTLQRGLFEEEANHNLDAAIQAYQSVVAHFDQDRKLAATAIFRLGECYRRQGKTNEANAQYERILREFSDQTALATLSRQNLVAFGATVPSPAATTPGATAPTSAEAEEVKRIQAMIKDSPDLINAKDSGGNTPLHQAAAKGQVIVATFLLQNGADIEAKDLSGQTPLYHAAVEGHKSVVELLLQKGASVRSANWRGETPLHAAAGKGFRSIVELLLARGAEVNAKTTEGTTPLHMAVANGFKVVADLLLSHGADANAVTAAVLDSTNQTLTGTPLQIAARVGDAAMAAALLDRGADLNILSKNDQTALHLCSQKGQIEVAKLLLSRGAGIDVTNSQGWTALCFAIRSKAVEMVALLLTNGANPNVRFEVNDPPVASPKPGSLTRISSPWLRKGYTPLLLATRSGYFEIVDLLLANKADPNLKSEEGDSALFNALSLWNAAEIKHLLESGAAVNDRDAKGRTPLMLAALEGKKEILELCLGHKAEVNAQDTNGWSALHFLAEFSTRGNATAMTEALLAAGADVNLQNYVGYTALNIALAPRSSFSMTQGEFAEVLRRHGAAEFLPNPGRLEIRRGQSYSSVVFTKGTNDWNQFTLFELLAAHLGLLGTSPSGEQQTKEAWDLLVLNGLYGPGRSLENPDFSHVRIRQPAQNQNGWQDSIVDVAAALKSGDCSKNVPLQWGDVVEIPEANRPRNDEWRGFSKAELATLDKCVARQVEITLSGQSTNITLAPEIDERGYVVTKVPFWIAPVLRVPNLTLMDLLRRMKGSTGLLDYSHVKITRKDPSTGQQREWVLDCSPPKPAPDFWLRDGDVVEVPEKH